MSELNNLYNNIENLKHKNTANFNLNNLPKELKLTNHWVVWKLENYKKIPYQAKKNYRLISAKTNDPLTWVSFDILQKNLLFYEEKNIAINGIGFVFFLNNFIGIDFDDCLDKNLNIKKDSYAVEFILNSEIGKSYCEISQSGRGLHIIINSPDFYPFEGKRYKNIEIYNNGRYFALTGNLYKSNSNKIQKISKLVFEDIIARAISLENKDSFKLDNFKFKSIELKSGEKKILSNENLMLKSESYKGNHINLNLSKLPLQEINKLSLNDKAQFIINELDKKKSFQKVLIHENKSEQEFGIMCEICKALMDAEENITLYVVKEIFYYGVQHCWQLYVDLNKRQKKYDRGDYMNKTVIKAAKSSLIQYINYTTSPKRKILLQKNLESLLTHENNSESHLDDEKIQILNKSDKLKIPNTISYNHSKDSVVKNSTKGNQLNKKSEDKIKLPIEINYKLFSLKNINDNLQINERKIQLKSYLDCLIYNNTSYKMTISCPELDYFCYIVLHKIVLESKNKINLEQETDDFFIYKFSSLQNLFGDLFINQIDYRKVKNALKRLSMTHIEFESFEDSNNFAELTLLQKLTPKENSRELRIAINKVVDYWLSAKFKHKFYVPPNQIIDIFNHDKLASYLLFYLINKIEYKKQTINLRIDQIIDEIKLTGDIRNNRKRIKLALNNLKKYDLKFITSITGRGRDSILYFCNNN